VIAARQSDLRQWFPSFAQRGLQLSRSMPMGGGVISCHPLWQDAAQTVLRRRRPRASIIWAGIAPSVAEFLDCGQRRFPACLRRLHMGLLSWLYQLLAPVGELGWLP
jgi:hypothetical protein